MPETQIEELRAQFSSGDATLDSHILGGIPLKHVDFTSPEIYKNLKYKKPRNKKEVYLAQKEKMEILLRTFTREDF